MTRIAFIGLGKMGSGMAARLAGAGHRVAAFDLSDDAVKQAASSGCVPAASAAEALHGAEAVISMLPAGPHVRALYEGEVLVHAPTGALLADCSTIDVDTARQVASTARAKGYRFADAPVSGGTAGAAAGTLAFMVGCDEADFADFEALLAPMARAVIRAGDHGAGQAAKICNNLLLGISMIGVSEAFALAERLGLEPQRFFDIASKSSGQCWSLTTYCPWPGVGPETPADHGYEGGFATAMMLKDLRLAADAAAKAGASIPLGAEAVAVYALLDKLGYAAKDFSFVVQLLRGEAHKPATPLDV